MYHCRDCDLVLNKGNCIYISSLYEKTSLTFKKRKLIDAKEINASLLCDLCYNKLTDKAKELYLSNIDTNEFNLFLNCQDDIKLNNDYKNTNNKKIKIDNYYIPRPPSHSPPPRKKPLNNTKLNNNKTKTKNKKKHNKKKNKKDNVGDNNKLNNDNDDDDDDDNDNDNDNDDDDDDNKNLNNNNDLFNYLFGLNKSKPSHFIIIDDMNNSNNTSENPYNEKNKNNDIHIKNSIKEKECEKEEEGEEGEEGEVYEFYWLGDDINSINDLIKIGESYEEKKKEKKRYNLNIHKLNKLVDPLKELQKMIGLTDIKDAIFNQIIYYLQDLDNKNTDMLHTVIEGPPGVGKTHICHILAGIYKSLGFLKNNKVISVKRDDFIAKYLGQTADKTRHKIEEALGGVLFIDEAYSMGDIEGRDSYSKEAIDMLTSYLSEHPHDLICIVAGYKEALQKRFFSQNEGLSRRFAHRFELTDYSPEDLRLIFFKIVEEGDWNILDKEKVPSDFFSKNIKCFKYNGGDMLTLFGYCKKTHSKRLLKIAKEEKILLENKKKLNLEDIEEGLTLFLKNPEYAKRLEEGDSHMGLYT